VSRLRHRPLMVVALLAAAPPGSARAQGDWDLLGSRRVRFAAERDVIEVGGRDGRFTALRIDVHDGSRVIGLPGSPRVIRRIDFSYRSLARGRRRRATVRVEGRR
jgi:hypothetical protein